LLGAKDAMVIIHGGIGRKERIGHLYPKIEVTTDMAQERPALKRHVAQRLTVIAWLWARTAKSPNPAFADVDVPLASSFMLSTKAGKETYVESVIRGGRASCPMEGEEAGRTPAPLGFRFTVKVGKPKDAEGAKNGTKLARGANFVCLMSGAPISGDYRLEFSCLFCAFNSFPGTRYTVRGCGSPPATRFNPALPESMARAVFGPVLAPYR
jgi:adenine-specific DNA methylase